MPSNSTERPVDLTRSDFFQTGKASAGLHMARISALAMFDQARAAGKEREAEVFWRWLADVSEPEP
jgi:hypothetical protein